MNFKQIRKIVITTLEWEIFLILMAILLLVVSPILPLKNYFSSYVVVSGSMEPRIPRGALVFLDTKTTNLHPGDIVGFTSPLNPEMLVIHRIVEIQGEGAKTIYITKGDNNDSEDAWSLSGAQIKGTYVTRIPYIGYLTNYIKTPKGFAAAVGIPAMILIFMQVKKIKEGIDEEIEKRTRERIVTTIAK